MTDSQIAALAMAMSPTVIAVLIGILISNSGLSDLRTHLDARINELDGKMDQRFNDAKESWRAELHRVEEVLDARLKHLEER